MFVRPSMKEDLHAKALIPCYCSEKMAPELSISNQLEHNQFELFLWENM